MPLPTSARCFAAPAGEYATLTRRGPRLAYAEDAPEASVAQLVLGEDGDVERQVRGELDRVVGEGLGEHLLRGSVGEVADGVHGLGDHGCLPHRRLLDVDLGRQDQGAGVTARLGRRRAAERVELVGGEGRALEDRQRLGLGRHGQVEHDAVDAGQLTDGRPGRVAQRLDVDDVAEAHEGRDGRGARAREADELVAGAAHAECPQIGGQTGDVAGDRGAVGSREDAHDEDVGLDLGCGGTGGGQEELGHPSIVATAGVRSRHVAGGGRCRAGCLALRTCTTPPDSTTSLPTPPTCPRGCRSWRA
jgi:hypothetical protein